MRPASSSTQLSSRDRPLYMPKLSYRRPVPLDIPPIPSRLSTSTVATDLTADTTATQSTISTPSKSADGLWPQSAGISSGTGSSLSARRREQRTCSPVISASPKQKRSFLGALFVREPTSVALEQFAQQMVAQHGDLSPRAIPHVSSNKMPEKVPKVNSKWDGVPAAVKQRQGERQTRERKVPRAESFSASSGLSRGVATNFCDGSSRRHKMHDQRSSNSTLQSFENRGGSGGPHDTQHQNTSRSITSDSLLSGSSIDVATTEDRDRCLARSDSLRSPSGSSLPEITIFFPEDLPQAINIPIKHQGGVRPEFSASRMVTLLDPVLPSRLPPVREPTLKALPEHTSSPCATPHEVNQVTHVSESRCHGRDTIPASMVRSRSETVALLSPTSKEYGIAFLAGEATHFEVPDKLHAKVATVGSKVREHSQIDSNVPSPQPLSRLIRVEFDVEKRPRSSRARLGLRASILIGETPPWEPEEGLQADGSDLVRIPSQPENPSNKRS